MRNILFVDDESRILEGLQRMLRPRRDEWAMSFANSGEAALAMLEAAPFDVIVSDMQMPKMDGATLLTHVRDRFPNVVRIVLTGHTSLEASIRAVPVAHQFLAKPCDASVLQVAVERACALKASLSSVTLSRTISQIQDLPAMPRTFAALTKALGEPEASIHQIAQIIERDVAVAAKVLQLVNSPLFGASRHITAVNTAVSYLGVNILKNLVLSIETFNLFGNVAAAGGYPVAQLHQHAHLSARIAARLPTQGHFQDAACVAALLHDIGTLVLMAKLPAQLSQALARAREEKCPVYVAEERLLGVTHAEIGAYLLGLWGLPYVIVESIAYHHAPARVPHRGFDSLAAVYVADTLAHEIEDVIPGWPQYERASPDLAYLEAIGVADQLPAWRAMAAEVADQANGADGAGGL